MEYREGNDGGKILSSIFAIDRLSNPNDRSRPKIVAPFFHNVSPTIRRFMCSHYSVSVEFRLSALHIAGLDVTLRN